VRVSGTLILDLPLLVAPSEKAPGSNNLTHRARIAVFTDKLSLQHHRARSDLTHRARSIVIIAHRVHQDDLIGRLLAQEAAGGDKWTVVELKAVNDSGEALWPEKYDREALERIKANSTPHYWSALYQQSPSSKRAVSSRKSGLNK
jgi:hypothetical protein